MALTDLFPDPNAPPSPLLQAFKSGALNQNPAPPTLGDTPGLAGPPPSLGASALKPIITPRMQREDQLQQQISQYNNPQKPQGFWQNLRHVAATVGNIAGDIVAPSTMELIPGTQLHNRIQEAGRNRELAGLQQEDRQDTLDAQTSQNDFEENNLRESQAKEADARAQAALQPKPETKDWQVTNDYVGPNGEPVEMNKTTGEMRIAQTPQGIKRFSADKPGNDFEQFYKDYITDNHLPDSAHNRLLARKEFAAAGQAPQRPAQVTVVVPDGKGGGTVETLHPGDAVQPGTETPTQLGGANSKAAGALADAKTSADYANNYIQSGKFTGPGDEALLEKYFDLAKPSTGFRMTQQQIELLQSSRSWMGSAEGEAYHAKTGTWFSAEQRQQIADTMNTLYQAKAGPGGGGPIVQHSQSTGQFRYSTDGGKTWQQGKPPSQHQ